MTCIEINEKYTKSKSKSSLELRVDNTELVFQMPVGLPSLE